MIAYWLRWLNEAMSLAECETTLTNEMQSFTKTSDEKRRLNVVSKASNFVAAFCHTVNKQ